MKKIYLLKQSLVLSTALLFFTHCIQAQNIFPSTGSAGIGTTTPDASSILDMVSTTKGILVPRMTITQRNAIKTPATGLLIYQTNNTPGFYYYTGTAWTAVTPKAKGWSLTGNSGTIPGTNFIGTTDAQPLVFKVNNQNAGYLGTSATVNTAFGNYALNANTSGVANTAIGFSALSANISGNNNLAIGVQALGANTSGSDNTASGLWSLVTNTTGNFNTATGGYSLYFNSDGIDNTANGISSLRYNTHGNNNTATGANTLFNNTTGYSNVAVGSNALFNNTTTSNNVAVGDSALYNQNGSLGNNTAVGSKAMYANSSGNYNTATGNRALYANTSGSYNSANGYRALYTNGAGTSNTASGYSALYANSTGSYNTANGSFALLQNSTGYNNTASGWAALYSNDVGYSNTASGYGSLYSNTSGNYNTADGQNSLYSNTDGGSNSATGYAALYHNTGSNNTGNGRDALAANTTGDQNTGNGAYALLNNTTGYNNTALGYAADVTFSGNLTNAMALGANTQVNASNKVVVGNPSVTVIGGWVAGWSILSDGRFKTNIKENVPGLAFINKLKPVTYNLEVKKFDKFQGKKDSLINSMQADYAISEKKVHTGFVAQDVEKAAQELHYDFDGVNHPQNEKDNYSLVYADFVPSLVKAVQELSARNDDLEARLQKLETLLANQSAGNQTSSNLKPQTSNFSLDQNIPNPFSNTTTINYSLPQHYSSAKIIVVDESGNTIKVFNLSGTRKGSINFSSPFRVGASYQYSLLVDGKLIETKQMILAK